MFVDYNTLELYSVESNSGYITLSWICNLGYGELIIKEDTNEVVEDEFMGEEFCKKVIELYLENKNGDS